MRGGELCEVEALPRETVGVFEEDARFVAHAFGSPKGLAQSEIYTNSREAFETSYYNGYRAFEVDLMVLADGAVAAVHDAHEHEYGLTKAFRMSTRAEIEDHPWRGKYDILFAEDIIDLMVEHPDVWVILDTKCEFVDCDIHVAQTLVDLAPDDSVRDRIVPHLTSGDMHVQMLLGVYPFPERMYARYQWPGSDATLLERLEEFQLENIMMFWGRENTEWTDGFQQMLEAAGKHVWVHTPTEPDVIEAFVARGVGTYTNGFITCPPPP